jgi:uncharacterized membrane protein YuzA (DUF378 family)
LMILMKTWMVNTISKTNWINQLKTLSSLGVFFFNLVQNLFGACNILAI